MTRFLCEDLLNTRLVPSEVGLVPNRASRRPVGMPLVSQERGVGGVMVWDTNMMLRGMHPRNRRWPENSGDH
jgi:hypothetical protein